MKTGIVAENVTKIYRSKKHKGLFHTVHEDKVALSDFSFCLPPGRITGLLGLNGAGKTTTIKILSTLLMPTFGHIEVDGLEMQHHLKQIRRRINMVAGGERMVYWRLTGRENLWYFAQLYDVDSRVLQQRIDALLDMVGLQEAADTVVERYSKGMKQRLQIARGLINDPDYIFLDEPTIGLDIPIAREMRAIIQQQAAQGKAILLTSHYLQEVEELCEHIYVIDKGGLVAQGSPDELKRLTCQKRVVRMVLPDLPETVATALRATCIETGAQLEEERGQEGVMVTVSHPEDVCGHLVTAVTLHGGGLLRLEVVEPSLEDALVALTSQSKAQEVTHVTG